MVTRPAPSHCRHNRLTCFCSECAPLYDLRSYDGANPEASALVSAPAPSAPPIAQEAHGVSDAPSIDVVFGGRVVLHAHEPIVSKLNRRGALSSLSVEAQAGSDVVGATAQQASPKGEGEMAVGCVAALRDRYEDRSPALELWSFDQWCEVFAKDKS